MPSVVRTIGGAGTGKTTRLLNLMMMAAEAGGYSPFEIGFVSFTRAARLEAAERAAQKFSGVSADDLQQLGWFRTLHSCCFRLLNAKQDNAISDTVKDRSWIAENVGDQVSGADEGSENPFAGKLPADRALSIWSTARNKLCGFADVHSIAVHCDRRTPDLNYCRNIVEKYEQAKRLDGRYDFTDLIGRYAGRTFSFEGPRETRAEGDIPEVPVWFLDEQQDTSALLDLVCRRLVSCSRWVYLSLDPFQSVFGWSGASYKHAMAWEVQKEEVLDQSHRCPKEISILGEQCLKRCSDYWDRGIRPADHSGIIEELPYETPWTEQVDPNESWLLLGRTNFIAQRLAKRLEPHHIPWVPTTGGNNRWNAPVRQKVMQAMMSLSMGGAIGLGEWKQVLKEVTGKDYFERGTKKRFADARESANEMKFAPQLKEWGATDKFISLVQSGRWHALVAHAPEYQTAADRWGLSAAFGTGVRVGTIHSVKGAEADNVVILKSTSEQVHRGMDFQDVADEENRLAYVGVTRARKRLIVLHERDARFEMEIV